MFIKNAGTYLALGDQYVLLFRAVGEFPFFRIPTGIVLNDYIKGGELKMVKENEVEIQGLINHPEHFAIASLDAITDDGSFRSIDFKATGKVLLDPETESKLIDKIKYIDMPYSGVSINSLYYEIIRELNMSLPQARLVVQVLRKKIRDEKNRRQNSD